VIETGRTMMISKKYYDMYLKTVMPAGVVLEFPDDDSFWVKLTGIDQKTGETKIVGQVRLGITILPKELAAQSKVGDARQEPNHDPFLPPPTGRMELSLNPFKMLVSFLLLMCHRIS